MKGTGANLCKVTSKRRRPKAEVEQEKLFRANAEQLLKAKEQEIEDMKRQMENFGEENGDIINRVTFMTELMEAGKVIQREDGEYEIVGGKM